MHFIRWCNLRHEVPQKKKSGTDKIYAYLITNTSELKLSLFVKYKVKLYLLQATPTPKRKQLKFCARFLPLIIVVYCPCFLCMSARQCLSPETERK